MPTVEWYDENGARVDDARDAVFGEIHDGEKRIYVDPAGWAVDGETEPVGPALDDPNTPWAGADLIKIGTWDVRTPDFEPVATLAGLLEALQLSDVDPDVQRGQVAEFVRLPAWVPAPDPLKREVAAWLG